MIILDYVEKVKATLQTHKKSLTKMTNKTTKEKIKFDREEITCRLPAKVIQQLTSLGKKVKKENGVVFAHPIEVAICTLMSKGLGG